MYLYVICWFVFCVSLGMWRRKVRAVEIWGKQRAERGVLLPWYYYFRGEEIAETKGEDFLRACRFEKWEADRAASCCALPVRNIELHMVLVSTYTDGPSAFRYQRAHKVRKKYGIDMISGTSEYLFFSRLLLGLLCFSSVSRPWSHGASVFVLVWSR